MRISWEFYISFDGLYFIGNLLDEMEVLEKFIKNNFYRFNLFNNYDLIFSLDNGFFIKLIV